MKKYIKFVIAFAIIIFIGVEFSAYADTIAQGVTDTTGISTVAKTVDTNPAWLDYIAPLLAAIWIVLRLMKTNINLDGISAFLVLCQRIIQIVLEFLNGIVPNRNATGGLHNSGFPVGTPVQTPPETTQEQSK